MILSVLTETFVVKLVKMDILTFSFENMILKLGLFTTIYIDAYINALPFTVWCTIIIR